MSWTADDLPDLGGKTVLVTGANSGIGFETARAFARHGARVLLACRDPERAQAACARIAAESPRAELELVPLDLASLDAVRAAVHYVLDNFERLDVLCNNAGVMAVPLRRTKDGFELQLGVNHFGHFALTLGLLELLRASGAARVVTVSSLVHRVASLDFDDLDSTRRYRKWEAYARSKLANLLFAYELQRRLHASGSRVMSLACHPGYANTNLQQVGPSMTGSRLGSAFYQLGNALFAQPAEQGAWPTLFAATAPELAGGEFIGPSGPFELFGAPRVVRSSRASHDLDSAQRLWAVSLERTRTSEVALARA